MHKIDQVQIILQNRCVTYFERDHLAFQPLHETRKHCRSKIRFCRKTKIITLTLQNRDGHNMTSLIWDITYFLLLHQKLKLRKIK